MIGLEHSVNYYMNPSDRKRAEEALRESEQLLDVSFSQSLDGMVVDGRETWFSSRIAPLRHEQVIWLTRDITALKQAEAASILEERNRMAREIHDTLAQALLTAIQK